MCWTSARGCGRDETESGVDELSEAGTTSRPRHQGTLVLSWSPRDPVGEDSSSKISPASRPGARSALQLAAPPPSSPFPPAPSPQRGAPRSLVIPDAGASLPLALCARGLGGGDSDREGRGGDEREGLGRASASAVMGSWEQPGAEQ